MTEDEELMHLVVDDERFEVRQRPGFNRQYDVTWVSGRNRGYGFSAVRSDGASMTRGQLEDQIRDFLRNVDPETGYQ